MPVAPLLTHGSQRAVPWFGEARSPFLDPILRLGLGHEASDVLDGSAVRVQLLLALVHEGQAQISPLLFAHVFSRRIENGPLLLIHVMRELLSEGLYRITELVSFGITYLEDP